MRTVLVTGHRGFVGQHLVSRLVDEGDTVIGFDAVDGDDVRDYERLRTIIEHTYPDLIFHLAAQAFVPESTTDPHRAVDVNITGTLNLLEAVRHTGCRPRILLAGTSEEYGYEHDLIDESTPTTPTTPYGVTKLAAGHLGLTYARTYGLNVVITRAFNHTGPGHSPVYALSSFARRVALIQAGRLDVLEHGNLDVERSYTDVRDVVDAYRRVIEAPTGVYNVGSADVRSLRLVLNILCDVAGREVPLREDPALYRPGWQRGDERSFPRLRFAKVKLTTGWHPRIGIRETLKDMLTYWTERV